MKKGYTLAEMMVTVAILALLILVSVPIVNNTLERTSKKTFTSSMKETLRASEIYFVENGTVDGECVDITLLDLEIKESNLEGSICYISKKATLLDVKNDKFIANGNLDTLEVELID